MARLGFHHPTAGYIAALFPRSDHVKVGFEQGHDPDGLLTKEGRQVRYLVVTEWTDDLTDILDAFLAQAVDTG